MIKTFEQYSANLKIIHLFNSSNEFEVGDYLDPDLQWSFLEEWPYEADKAYRKLEKMFPPRVERTGTAQMVKIKTYYHEIGAFRWNSVLVILQSDHFSLAGTEEPETLELLLNLVAKDVPKELIIKAAEEGNSGTISSFQDFNLF